MRQTCLPALVLAVLLTIGLAPIADANQRYVGDRIDVTFRSGPGTQYRVIRYVSTGTLLRVTAPPEGQFSAEAMDGWTFVTLQNGDQGWVQDQYMIDRPPARDRIEGVQTELAAARAELARGDARLSELRGERDEFGRELAAADERIAALEADLLAASDGYELVQANEALREQALALNRRLQELERQNRRLADNTRQEYFLTGAGVLSVGLLLGLILPSLRRKKSSWS